MFLNGLGSFCTTQNARITHKFTLNLPGLEDSDDRKLPLEYYLLWRCCREMSKTKWNKLFPSKEEHYLKHLTLLVITQNSY